MFHFLPFNSLQSRDVNLGLLTESGVKLMSTVGMSGMQHSVPPLCCANPSCSMTLPACSSSMWKQDVETSVPLWLQRRANLPPPQPGNTPPPTIQSCRSRNLDVFTFANLPSPSVNYFSCGLRLVSSMTPTELDQIRVIISWFLLKIGIFNGFTLFSRTLIEFAKHYFSSELKPKRQ